ncbi:cell division protein ZapA [Denitratimonas sp. CY0512]|mgnify:CR=1 FL=1|uniref:cell division protein ZapA n=1 Tax=Denitratimonas sp. CY0512 TaxID=3131940 RepID=UPI0016AD5D5C|nr:cell division protein ZapA [Gammaproteobacteria bacterium]
MSEPVSVRIVDREYLVACEPEERDGLIQAAQMLDRQMREIRAGNRMAGIDRIAVLAALNLAHELQQLRRGEQAEHQGLALVLGEMSRKLDRLLNEARQR